MDAAVHLNGRVYDPLVGKFISADPFISDPVNGQNYNRYSYVLNNPTNLTDPTGFADCDPNKGGCPPPTPTPTPAPKPDPGERTVKALGPDGKVHEYRESDTKIVSNSEYSARQNSAGNTTANPKNLASSGTKNLTEGDILKSYAAGAANSVTNGVISAANFLMALGDITGTAELFPHVDIFTPKSAYFGSEGAATADGLSVLFGGRVLGGGTSGLLEGGAATNVIDPAIVRFSQSSGRAAFSDGGSIQGMADALKSGTLKPNEVPAIRLVEKDGTLFTLDNRRLEAFRRAGVNVPYRMATPEEAASEGWKFTTKNNGVSMRIRGE